MPAWRRKQTNVSRVNNQINNFYASDATKPLMALRRNRSDGDCVQVFVSSVYCFLSLTCAFNFDSPKMETRWTWPWICNFESSEVPFVDCFSTLFTGVRDYDFIISLFDLILSMGEILSVSQLTNWINSLIPLSDVVYVRRLWVVKQLTHQNWISAWLISLLSCQQTSLREAALDVSSHASSCRRCHCGAHRSWHPPAILHRKGFWRWVCG